MAQTLRVVATLARDLANDQGIEASTAAGEQYCNRVYRQAAGMWRWPELQRQATLTTVAVQESYSATALATMRDITLVEMEDDRDGDKFAPIAMVNSMSRWVRAGHEDAGFPDYCNLEDSAGVPKASFRPVPATAQAGNTIRATGYIVPADLSATETTFFRSTMGDDFLAHMLAADRLFQKGQTGRGNRLQAHAAELFKRLTGSEVVPAELAQKMEE